MRETRKPFALAVRWSAGLALCCILATPLTASALTNPVLGGTGAGVGDYLEYNSRPNTVAPCETVSTPFCTFLNNGVYPPVASLSQLLTGVLPPPPGSAGGNVELFANSENLNVDQFAAYTGVTTLSGSLDGVAVVLSSLVWDDWEVESYNCAIPTATALPGGLLDRWVDDLLAAYSLNLTPAQRDQVITSLVCDDYLQRFSDPNIAYVNDAIPNNGMADPVIGLSGTYDLCPTLASLIPGFPAGACAIPNRPPVQVSELVKLEADGLTTILYNFEAVVSGQSALNSPGSHTGIYELIAPFDPPNGQKVGVTVGEDGGKPIIEWTISWVNDASEDRYVRIFDRLTDGSYYDVNNSVTCTLTASGGATVPAVPIPTNLRYGIPGSSAQQNGSCGYDAGLDGILFEGVIPGISNPDYQNTVKITFQYVPDQTPVVYPLENTACVTWDSNGDGNLDTVPACLDGAAAPPAPPGPQPIPVMQPFGLALLSFGLLIAAGWARRRR